MHTLFNNPHLLNTGTQTLPSWNNARPAVYAELNKMVDYFRQSSEWIKNHHPLVKLLKNDSTPLYSNADYTLEAARNYWIENAGLFGISTPYRKASYAPENIAYPSNTIEYLVMDDSIPMGNEVKLKWKTLEPIRVLDHPYSDLDLSIPNGKFVGKQTNGQRAYICINIPVLVLQYRLWQKYEAERGGLEPDSPSIFLARYPLVNIINSHMDVVIRNRLINMYHQIDPADFNRIRQGGVAVNDTSHYVDRTLRECIKVITSADMSFNELNLQVPQLSYNNVAQSLILPEMTYTRSVRWVYDASRIKWLSFLVEYNNDRRIFKNNPTLDYLRRRLRQMSNDKEFGEAVGLSSEGIFTRLRDMLE